MHKLEEGDGILKPNLDTIGVMLETREKRGPDMFSNGLTMEQPIDLNNLSVLSPIKGEILKTEQRIQGLLTNPAKYRTSKLS